MAWYAAHIIVYTKFLEGFQDKYPVWENIVLIEASSIEKAYEDAEHIGKNDYESDPSNSSLMTWEGRPAIWVFAGVRKLVECQYVATVAVKNPNDELIPKHGTEVSYLQLEVRTEEDLQKLVAGEPVNVNYDE